MVDVNELDGKSPQPSGTPKQIAFFNSWAELWPSPNSAFSFQLRYRASPSDITGLDDIPSLTTPWRMAVLKKTEEKVFRFLNDEVGAANAQSRYMDYVYQIKTDDAKRQAFRGNVGFTPYWSPGGRRKV